jgi:hypothetical protein
MAAKQTTSVKLYMRVADAKGATIYGMPGGRVAMSRVPFGTLFLLAGDGMFYVPEGIWYFPVQVGMTILWASERGFGIVKKVPQ